VDRYRSGAYFEDNPDWHEADAPWKVRSVAALVRFAGLAPHTVVDVGCGTGAVLAGLADELRPELPETTWEGWDIAPAAIARARTRERTGLSYVCGDFLDSERRVDLILCLDVVEHLSDEHAFLTALRERAAGFVFRIPLDLSVLDVVRPTRMLELRRRHGHVHAYTRETALALLRECGFRIEVERLDRVPPATPTARARAADRVRRVGARIAPRATVRWLGGFSLLLLARSARS
jgi:SAM-dependent methyltransferase